MTKNGGGTLILAASNGYSGGTTLAAGLLGLSNAAALGSGPLTIAGGTLDNTSGAAMTLSTNNAQNWNGDFTFLGSSPLNLGTGAVTLGSARTVTVSAGTLTVGGAVSGGYALTKAGPGLLTLAANPTYTGATTVSAGTLNLVDPGIVSSTTISTSAGSVFEITANNTGVVSGGNTSHYLAATSIGGSGTLLKTGTSAYSPCWSQSTAFTMAPGGLIDVEQAAISWATATTALGRTTRAG